MNIKLYITYTFGSRWRRGRWSQPAWLWANHNTVILTYLLTSNASGV